MRWLRALLPGKVFATAAEPMSIKIPIYTQLPDRTPVFCSKRESEDL